MFLGSVLQHLDRYPDPIALLAEDLDLVTLSRASADAARSGESLSEYLRDAVAAFMREADESDWTQLVGRLQDGRCGAAACLNLMLRWQVRRRARRDAATRRGSPTPAERRK